MFVILLTISVIVATIGLTMNSTSTNFLVRGVNDSIGFFQQLIVSRTTGISHFVTNTRNLFNNNDEFIRMRSDMYTVEMIRIENELLEEENSSLRTALGIKNTLSDFEMVIGNVIGRNINNWHDFILLDQGHQHGIEEGMAVISKEGFLIGRITEVNQFSSRMHFMKPHNTDIRAHVEILGVDDSQGIFHGYNSETGELYVTQVSRDVELEEGLKVITSGMGGVFPRGLLAGFLNRSEVSNDGLRLNLFLTNEVNYSELHHVFIVKRLTANPFFDNPVESLENEEYEDENATDEQTDQEQE